jgi:hypothetical protein
MFTDLVTLISDLMEADKVGTADFDWALHSKLETSMNLSLATPFSALPF